MNETPSLAFIDSLATPGKLALILLEMLFWYGLVVSLFLLAVSYCRARTVSVLLLV